jgi:hypothetical protein
MVQNTRMSEEIGEELLNRLTRDDDPKVEARLKMMVRVLAKVAPEQLLRRRFTQRDPELAARRQLIERLLLEENPEVKERLMAQGGLLTARAALHRVLARRKIPLTPDQHARIEQCSDPATLERWHDQAITAASAAEALQ